MPDPRPPKKSESLEIRIPHPTKEAFMARCRAQGQSASETLRVFIEGELAVPQVQVRRPLVGRGALRLALGVLTAGAVAAVALPSLARSDQRAAFESLDTNHDHSLSLAEFAASAAVKVDVRLSGASVSASPEGDLRAALVRAAFTRLDVNGDGQVSFDEFNKAHP